MRVKKNDIIVPHKNKPVLTVKLYQNTFHTTGNGVKMRMFVTINISQRESIFSFTILDLAARK